MRRDFSRNTQVETADHRMKVYSLAAAAAGVSMLALAQPVEGKVIVTKKNIPINGPVSIDLNKDGIADFEFSFITESTGTCCTGHTSLVTKPLTGGGVVGHKNGSLGPYASALIKGSKIGPSAHFAHSHGQITIERKSHSGSIFGYGGNWYYVGPNRFLGVKFLIHGETHYGWIRLTVDIPGSFASTITGYAYETTANKPITAGSTTTGAAAIVEIQNRPIGPSLGMLARGADAMQLWRREEWSASPGLSTTN